MLGSGRPFLVEVQNARYVPSQESVKDLQAKINNLQNKLVRSLPTLELFLVVNEQLQKSTLWKQVGVKNLKLVSSQSWDLMREGEAEKQVFFSF